MRISPIWLTDEAYHLWDITTVIAIALAGLRRLSRRPRCRRAHICFWRHARSLRQAALWDEVKDKLTQSALGPSGGQQQRLCIARCLAVGPEVLLIDEPCSALDPIATARIEELMQGLAERYTIVIVTHNRQQAARVSDQAVVCMVGEDRAGFLAEVGPTRQVYSHPRDPRTEQYIAGRVIAGVADVR